MARFIDVTTDDGLTVYVNLDNVTRVVSGDNGESTAIYFVDDEDHIHVQESAKQIAEQAR